MSAENLLYIIVATPGAMVLAFGILWLLGVPLGERLIAGITKATYLFLTGMVVWMVTAAAQSGVFMVRKELGEWFHVADYGFPISLRADSLSLPLIALTVLLSGIVGAFSLRYLHRDPGFFRFFLLLHLFTFGALLIFSAESLDVLIAGWELVGVTSVLLIGFFQYRRDPVRNGLRVFATYRVADLGMLVAVFFSHHAYGSTNWNVLVPGDWLNGVSHAGGPAASAIAVLLVLAASGKSAQVPFCGWLARAMEGPTPSSAIFYGGISIHAGAYLLLRVQPLILASQSASWLLIVIGLATAFLGTLVHRSCADAKTSLCYAAQTQVGLIFVEIGMGWHKLALVHLLSHALLRTLQFLRAPSLLRDHHRIHSASGGLIGPTGVHYQYLMPSWMQVWLYRFALGRGFYDSIVDRWVVNGMKRCAVIVSVFEPEWMKQKARSTQHQES